jgi:hypothetical protein
MVNRQSLIQTAVIFAAAFLFGVFLPIVFGTGANGCRLGPSPAASGRTISAAATGGVSE